MSKIGYFWRYATILQKVKHRPYISKKDLLESLEKAVDEARNLYDDLEMGISPRTLERDFREIRNVLGISIEYSHSERGYYIDGDNVFGAKVLQQMLDSFSMLHTLNMATDLAGIVFTDQERPLGTEHLYGLINAIRNHLKIRFVYTKFWDDRPTERYGCPYALKEFDRRWYLLFHDESRSTGSYGGEEPPPVKVFGLDRISSLEISTTKFSPNQKVNVEAIFESCYGVSIPNDEPPQHVVLAFTPFKGKYVRSLPIHRSQKVVKNTPEEMQISLDVYLTYELEMKILSYGESVRVVEPQALKDRIAQKLKKTISMY